MVMPIKKTRMHIRQDSDELCKEGRADPAEANEGSVIGTFMALIVLKSCSRRELMAEKEQSAGR